MGGSGGENPLAKAYGRIADATLAAGKEQAAAIRHGADIQKENFEKAMGFLKEQYAQSRADLAPYQEIGTLAKPKLEAILGLKGDSASQLKELEASPGYQFSLQQGTEAIQKAYNAKGMLSSGNLFRELQSFGQGLATSTYNDRVSQLLATTDIGNRAAGGLAQLAENQGSTLAGLQVDIGDKIAAATVAEGNVLAQSKVAAAKTRYQYLTGGA